MNIYGKLNIFGELVYAPEILQDGNGTIILNPQDKDYFNNGYKLIIKEETPEEYKGKNTEIYYEEDGNIIYIKVRLVEETDIDNMEFFAEQNENTIIEEEII